MGSHECICLTSWCSACTELHNDNIILWYRFIRLFEVFTSLDHLTVSRFSLSQWHIYNKIKHKSQWWTAVARYATDLKGILLKYHWSCRPACSPRSGMRRKKWFGAGILSSIEHWKNIWNLKHKQMSLYELNTPLFYLATVGMRFYQKHLCVQLWSRNKAHTY